MIKDTASWLNSDFLKLLVNLVRESLDIQLNIKNDLTQRSTKCYMVKAETTKLIVTNEETLFSSYSYKHRTNFSQRPHEWTLESY